MLFSPLLFYAINPNSKTKFEMTFQQLVRAGSSMRHSLIVSSEFRGQLWLLSDGHVLDGHRRPSYSQVEDFQKHASLVIL